MPIKIVAWNLQNSFDIEKKMQPAIDAVERLDPDVAVFPEAFAEDQIELIPEVEQQFKALGYAVVHGPYYEPEQPSPQERQSMMAISRLEGAGSMVRLVYRNAVQLFPVDEATGTCVQVIGAHFDDRTEMSRVMQAKELIRDVIQDGPVVVGGDFNSLHGSGRYARALRSPAARWIARNIPHDELEWIGRRVTDMGTGTTQQILELGGLNETNARSQATWPSVFPQIELDHILVSDHIQATDFAVHRHVPVSDHRAISATLHT